MARKIDADFISDHADIVVRHTAATGLPFQRSQQMIAVVERGTDWIDAAGFDNRALIDLVGVVTEISFTNYTHNLTQIPVDFPSGVDSRHVDGRMHHRQWFPEWQRMF